MANSSSPRRISVSLCGGRSNMLAAISRLSFLSCNCLFFPLSFVCSFASAVVLLAFSCSLIFAIEPWVVSFCNFTLAAFFEAAMLAAATVKAAALADLRASASTIASLDFAAQASSFAVTANASFDLTNFQAQS